MDRAKERRVSRGRIRKRIRSKVSGTSERPRLAVKKSLKHIYAQVIDDAKGETLVAASSIDKTLKDGLKTGADIAAAVAVGKLLATRASEKGITTVVFDRGGYLFHGRVKALADAAREGGLTF
jgi:large subunit ribosomal protein L18